MQREPKSNGGSPGAADRGRRHPLTSRLTSAGRPLTIPETGLEIALIELFSMCSLRQISMVTRRPRPAAGTFFTLLAVLATAATSALCQDPMADEREAKQLPKMLRVPVTGVIKADMVERILRDVRKWLEEEPEIQYIVFEIDTPGGELEAAVELADFIFRELKKSVDTIAFIPPEKAALSAGALIAVAANHIIMGENTEIGAASPRGARPQPDGTVDFSEEDKNEVRAHFKTYAAEKYHTILTDAMVNEARSDIRRATTLEFRGGDEVEVTKFYTEADFKNLKRDKIRVLREEIVLRKGDLLTMTADEALDYGFARHIRNDLVELRNATPA